MTPDSPNVTEPVGNAAVYSPIQVRGTAGAGNRVTALLKRVADSTTLGTAVQVDALADGSFSLTYPYANQTAGDGLTLEVTQTSAAGLTSQPLALALTQQTVFAVVVDVSQALGDYTGSKVHVWAMPDATSSYGALVTGSIDVTDGVLIAGATTTLSLPDGTFTLRAWRDANDDGLPTLNRFSAEPQSVGVALTVNGADTNSSLSLTTAQDPSTYTDVDAYALNSQAWEDMPLCGGFRIFLGARLEGTAADLSPITAITPRGPIGLLDDGACDNANNASGSFDWTAGDGMYSAGFSGIDDDDAGEYIFHFLNTAVDAIHVESDPLAAPLIKLPTFVPLTAPTGAARVTTTTTTLTWEAVADATAYDVQRSIAGSTSQPSFDEVTTNSVQATDLADATSYSVDVRPVALRLNGQFARNYDARSEPSVRNAFVVDTTGNATVTVTGSITNSSGLTGRFFVEGIACRRESPDDPAECVDQPQATVVLPAVATSYTLVLPKVTTADRGTVRLYIDVTGEWWLFGRDSVEQEQSGLDMTGDLGGVDFVFLKRPVLLLPIEGATNTGNTPAFTWQAYADTPGATPAVYSVVFYANPEGSGDDMPVIAWGLPDTATSFDMAAPPADKFDIINFMGGTPSEADLSSATAWFWGIAILECDYGDASYEPCLTAILAGGGGPSVDSSRSLRTGN